MEPTVLYETRGNVAWLTLNRPEVLNAQNMQMRDEFWVLTEAIAADDSIRAVVFRGAGERAFSAGADISEFGTSPSYVESRRARMERDLWGRLAYFGKPMVAAVHGFALGAGCELSLLCDFIVASEDARFGLPETHLGYIPTAGGSQTLPRAAGTGRALDMILTAEAISAQRALDYGMLYAVVPREALETAAGEVASRLAEAPPAPLLATRRAMREGADLPATGAIRLERRFAAQIVNT